MYIQAYKRMKDDEGGVPMFGPRQCTSLRLRHLGSFSKSALMSASTKQGAPSITVICIAFVYLLIH